MSFDSLSRSKNDFQADWINLFRVGGLSAFLVALFIPLQIIIFILYPPPTTVLD